VLVIVRQVVFVAIAGLPRHDAALLKGPGRKIAARANG
jgi:hypothetical protein